jgi:thiol-disulfide isomerase/thioredoxin
VEGVNRNAVVIAVVILAVTGMLVAGKYLARSGGANGAVGTVRGAQAPDFSLPALDGQTLHLADLRGKAVLVNFWATWCGPCKIEMPWFVELQKQYGPQGLEIVGVALDDSGKEAISKFAQETGVNYPILLGTDKVGDAYQVQGLPTTYYLGRDGRIVGRTFGLVSHREIEKNIEAALKAAPVSAQGTGK